MKQPSTEKTYEHFRGRRVLAGVSLGMVFVVAAILTYLAVGLLAVSKGNGVSPPAGDSEACRSAFRTDVDHDSEVMTISVPN